MLFFFSLGYRGWHLLQGADGGDLLERVSAGRKLETRQIRHPKIQQNGLHRYIIDYCFLNLNKSILH